MTKVSYEDLEDLCESFEELYDAIKEMLEEFTEKNKTKNVLSEEEEGKEV